MRTFCVRFTFEEAVFGGMASANSKYRDTIARLDGSGQARTRKFRLQRNRQSLRCNVMKRAWEDAGVSLNDPCEVKQTYFPDEGLIVLDFQTDE